MSVKRLSAYVKDLGEHQPGIVRDVVLASDFDAEVAAHAQTKRESAERIAELEKALQEAIELMHKDLAAYKREAPMVTAEMEAFVDRYAMDRGGEHE